MVEILDKITQMQEEVSKYENIVQDEQKKID
jgi:hypothetical protein